MGKILYWFISCFRAFRSFSSNTKFHEKKREIVWFGPSPPFGKKTNYFPFFFESFPYLVPVSVKEFACNFNELIRTEIYSQPTLTGKGIGFNIEFDKT